MTTIINETKTQPAIVMDKLHVDSFTLQHAREDNPKRVIGMSVCLYGVDVNGNKIFDKETTGIIEEDFDTTVVGAALASGQTIEEFMVQYASDKAAVAAELNTGVTDTKLMAYFEAALGRIAELNGAFTINSVE